MNSLGALKRLPQSKTLSLCTLNMCDRRSLRDIARQIGIGFGAIQSILTDILEISKVTVWYASRMLTKDQKNSRLDMSKYLPSFYKDELEEFMR